MKESQKLLNKVAVITGSDSGIGQAVAIEFANHGADIVICEHSKNDGSEVTLREVEKRGRKAIVTTLDQSDVNSVEKMFDAAIKKFKTVDILVNAAGVDASGVNVADLTDKVWDKAIRTNLYGYFYCCRRFANIRKKDSGKGKIINVTSIHAEYPRAGASDYDCSKAAQKMLTSTLALELAPYKINVNNIAPGMVLTPFNQKAIDDPKFLKEQVETIPWKRAANPDEIGKLAIYLASEESDYVTGTTFTIDGGLILNFSQGA